MNPPTGKVNEISPRRKRALYREMLRLRRVEERIADLITAEPPIKCPVHLYSGQEAVAVGVSASLRKDDFVYSTHRSHGHYLAKGGDLKGLMAELYGRATGCSGGYGGSMHLVDMAQGLPGSSAIVAGTIPLAVGAALAFTMQKSDRVAVAIFGDGATNEGAFYESLNFASLQKLPVVFVCENNLFSTHMPVDCCLADTRIYKKASIFNMPGYRLDGNDVVKIFQTAAKAIDVARRGEGPTLIECLTYRWRGHVGPNLDLEKGLRAPEELAAWKKRDPVSRLGKGLLKEQIMTRDDIALMTSQIDSEIEAAHRFALASPFPEVSETSTGVFTTGT